MVEVDMNVGGGGHERLYDVFLGLVEKKKHAVKHGKPKENWTWLSKVLGWIYVEIWLDLPLQMWDLTSLRVSISKELRLPDFSIVSTHLKLKMKGPCTWHQKRFHFTSEKKRYTPEN